MRIIQHGLKLVKEKEVEYDIDTNKINTPSNIVDIFNKVLYLNTRTQKVLAMMTINCKLEIASVSVISMGNTFSMQSDPKVIFQYAFLQN